MKPETISTITDAFRGLGECMVGATLCGLPIWLHVLQVATTLAEFVAATCGAVIGLHGVWRLWHLHKR